MSVLLFGLMSPEAVIVTVFGLTPHAPAAVVGEETVIVFCAPPPARVNEHSRSWSPDVPTTAQPVVVVDQSRPPSGSWSSNETFEEPEPEFVTTIVKVAVSPAWTTPASGVF